MKTILVATDFSPAAANAVAYATEMALSINADLFLLHIYSIPASYTEIPFVADMDEFQANAEDELNAIKEGIKWQTADKIFIETKVITGSFFDILKNTCEELIPYAVVMGSQGTSATERVMFGGHTIYAMKHLMWPLISVPNDGRYTSVKRIALACDFGESVDTIPVEEIIKLVSDFNAKLCILNTGRKDVFDPEVVFQSGLLHEKLLELNPDFEFISGTDTDDSILDFVDNHQIDLLMVLPKRHQLLDTLLHRSHTKKFVLHCHVPVMALKAAVANW